MEEVNQAAQQKVNPLLERIRMPGETFTLPSGGLFYKEGVLDPNVKGAEIHVHPMTAIDEIAMKTPDLLFSGNAVRQVFARCIPQVLNADGLLTKDVDFLLTCLRKVSYGDDMVINYTHNCEDAKEHEYVLSVTHFIQATKRIDPTTFHKDFEITFPNGQIAHIQPITYAEFVRMMQALNENTDADGTPEQLRDELVRSVLSVISDVDGITDTAMILEWLKGVPPQYIKMINAQVDKSAGWGTDFDVPAKCMDCGAEITISAPMNPLAFFT